MLSQSSKVPKVDNCELSKEQQIRKQKSSQKAVLSRYIFSRNSTKRFLAKLRGYMGTQERLRDNSRHTLEAILQVMRVVVNYRKGQKQLKKKLFYTQKVPWPDHLSTTECNLKCSQLLLQENQ